MLRLPAESNQNCENCEDHQNSVTSIGEIVSQDPELLMANENEEQDQTDDRSDEKQKPEEKPFRGTDAVYTAGIRVGKCNGASRQHYFQAVFEIFVGLFRIAANMLPHDVNDDSSDERVFNDERVQVWSGIGNDCSHDVDAFAAGGVQVEWRDGRESREVLKSFGVRQEVELVTQTFEFVVNVRGRIRSQVGDASELVGDR